MTDMLPVPALQINDPVLMLVSVKADDLPFQCVALSLDLYFRHSLRLV